MKRELLQEILPEGLVLQQEIGNGCWGHVFEAEDRRLTANSPLRRIVRFLQLDLSADSRHDLECHWKKIAQTDLPHVSRPLEMGRSGDGRIEYLVLDFYPSTLATRLAGEALNQNLAWALFQQLANGLAGLHAAGCVHGDLRPENVFLDAPLADVGLETRAWIGDAAVGPLSYWSRGEQVSNGSRRYFP